MTPEQLNALRRITRRLHEIGPFIADEAKLIESLLPPAEGVTHTQAEGRRASSAPRECEVTAAAHGPQAANDSGTDARANAANKRHCESILETWRKLNVGPRRRTAKAIDDMAAITEQVKDGELTPLEGLRRIATSLNVPQLLDVVVEGKAKTEPLIAQELDVDLGPVAGWARHEPFATIATVNDAERFKASVSKSIADFAAASRKDVRFSCSKPVAVGDQCEHVDVGMRSMSGLMEVVAIDREQKMLTTVSDKGTVNAQLRVIPAKALQYVPKTERHRHFDRHGYMFKVGQKIQHHGTGVAYTLEGFRDSEQYPLVGRRVDGTEMHGDPKKFDVIVQGEPTIVVSTVSASPDCKIEASIAPPADKYLSGEDPQLNDEVNAPINRIASTAIVDGISWGSGLVKVKSIFVKDMYGYFEPRWVRINECRLIERASHKPAVETKREPTISDQKPEPEKPLLDRYAEETAPIYASKVEDPNDFSLEATVEKRLVYTGTDIECHIGDHVKAAGRPHIVLGVDRNDLTLKLQQRPGDAPLWWNVSKVEFIDRSKLAPTEPTATTIEDVIASVERSIAAVEPGKLRDVVNNWLCVLKAALEEAEAKPLPTERPTTRKRRKRDASASKPVKTATPKVKATSDRGRSRPATRTKPAKTRAKQRKPQAKAVKPRQNPGIR